MPGWVFWAGAAVWIASDALIRSVACVAATQTLAPANARTLPPFKTCLRHLSAILAYGYVFELRLLFCGWFYYWSLLLLVGGSLHWLVALPYEYLANLLVVIPFLGVSIGSVSLTTPIVALNGWKGPHPFKVSGDLVEENKWASYILGFCWIVLGSAIGIESHFLRPMSPAIYWYSKNASIDIGSGWFLFLPLNCLWIFLAVITAVLQWELQAAKKKSPTFSASTKPIVGDPK
ncbi:MAG: hypothetical protein HY074_03135 [Deltaproteobacteria bacterium]|nr:hypothetical protein [Deltaproteobacteria bacterium]